MRLVFEFEGQISKLTANENKLVEKAIDFESNIENIQQIINYIVDSRSKGLPFKDIPSGK